MRILISSHRYAPDMGGVESSSAALAAQWRKLGHEVAIVTTTLGREPDGDPALFRRPSAWSLLRRVADCDVYWHNNISLQTAWPLFFRRRPWVVTTQCWLHDVKGRTTWNNRLKRRMLRRAHNVYISSSVARHVGLPGEIIPCPYDAAIFRRRPDVARDRELVFLGRLVSDKGADVLIRALAHLAPRLRPRLTVIGGGPEGERLRALCSMLGVGTQVDFVGWMSGEKLAKALNAHRVMVVPSIWAEPFGIVALEGLACGCRLIVSRSGGLPDAAGPGGATFTPGQSEELAGTIAGILAETEASGVTAVKIEAHLAAHTAEHVAARYLRLFESVRRRVP